MKSETRTIGALECRVVDTSDGDTPEAVVILCHGYGAPGQDLVPLSTEICALAPEIAGRVRFVFPAAPLTLPSFGFFDARAWWHIDVGRYERAMADGDLSDLQAQEPPGMEESRAKLLSVVEAVRAETGLPMNRLVLGGFSQGAMLATDVTLRLDEAPAALAILSGTLLCAETWRELAPRRAGLQVLQSHGHADPLLPFVAAENLRDMLSDAGLEVAFLPFHSTHTITHEVVASLAALVRGVL